MSLSSILPCVFSGKMKILCISLVAVNLVLLCSGQQRGKQHHLKAEKHVVPFHWSVYIAEK